MHSAVLQNKKYIQFADKSTVEVMAMGSLDRGIESGDPKAATYTVKNALGEKVEYLSSFPGLTVDDVNGLYRSKASSYNKTGGIPYTAIIDPHTLEQMHAFSGGTSAKSIMDQVMVAKKKLAKEHGQGLSRSDLRYLSDSESEVAALLADGSYKKALQLVGKVEKKSLPQSLTSRVSDMRGSILSAAKEKIAELEKSALTDPTSAKRALKKLSSELRGTELADKANELLDSMG